ncbi:MAG: 50S ribosomal protein L23 [Chloroflexi bacterium]|nr:50S ribosomal protein L23 [Chloroflexota bacterium]MQC28141.1 50S ribosomal protein L23 [Chloroflexota bacterium]
MPKAIHPLQVLRRPLVTEKTTMLSTTGQYVFEVDIRANKPQIAKAVELAFEVHVKKVRTMTVRGKMRQFGRRPARQPSWKKAIVTLAPGEQIQYFEGV